MALRDKPDGLCVVVLRYRMVRTELWYSYGVHDAAYHKTQLSDAQCPTLSSSPMCRRTESTRPR
jgi:hypothetical protein